MNLSIRRGSPLLESAASSEVPVIKSLLVVALVLGTSGVSAMPDPEPPAESFVLDSTSSTYPFVMRLEGSLRRRGSTIEVQVKRGEIRSAISEDLEGDGRATDVVISFGVGREVKSRWQMVKDTKPETVSSEIRPGEALPVTPHKFVIEGLAEVPVADMWLAARLSVNQKLPGIAPGPLSSYACSGINLSGETPASGERAKAMAQNYAHTC